MLSEQEQSGENEPRCTGSVVVSTSTWPAGGPGSVSGYGRQSIIGVKTWVSTFGIVDPS